MKLYFPQHIIDEMKNFPEHYSEHEGKPYWLGYEVVLDEPIQYISNGKLTISDAKFAIKGE